MIGLTVYFSSTVGFPSRLFLMWKNPFEYQSICWCSFKWRFCLINDFSWNYKNKKVSSTGKAFWLHIFLKVVSTTFGPITMFKQHSLSFHVVSKKFTTQNYLVFNPSNILCFSCFYLTCFALSCAFSTQR